MTWTANSCFVTLAILFLWRVEEIAEACSCSPSHPQQAFCSSDVGKLNHRVKWMNLKQHFSCYLFEYIMYVRIISFISGKVNCKCWGGKLPLLLCLQLQGEEDGIFCLSIFLSTALLSFSSSLCNHLLIFMSLGSDSLSYLPSYFLICSTQCNIFEQFCWQKHFCHIIASVSHCYSYPSNCYLWKLMLYEKSAQNKVFNSGE